MFKGASDVLLMGVSKSVDRLLRRLPVRKESAEAWADACSVAPAGVVMFGVKMSLSPNLL